MEYLKSAWLFFWGILKRIYLWAPALLLNPAVDIFNNFINPQLPEKLRMPMNIPSSWGFGLLLVLIAWAAILTYHELRKTSLKAESRISVSPVIVPTDWDSMACLQVVNEGIEPIQNCEGYLIATFEEVGGHLEQDRTVSPTKLRWSSRSVASEERESSHTIPRTADLDVVRIMVNSTNGISLCAISHQYHGYISAHPSQIFEIEVYADNCVPVRRKYRLTLDPSWIGSRRDYSEEDMKRGTPEPFPHPIFEVVNDL